MTVTCYACKKPATCVGQCEDSELEFCCDECCGHGNEDGWCIHLSPENLPKIIDRANRALRIEKENAAYRTADHTPTKDQA